MNPKSKGSEVAMGYLRTIAQLMYIKDKENPEDYLMLLAIKYLNYGDFIVHRSRLKALFKMSEKEIDPILTRLKQNGWIAEEDRYINPTGHGDMELMRIAGHVSQYIYEFRGEIDKQKRKNMSNG